MLRKGGELMAEDNRRVKAEWLKRLHERIGEISPGEAAAEVEREAVILVDVREGDEFRREHVKNALHLPRGFLELRAEERLPDKAQPLVTYCGSGVRALFAAETLEKLGFSHVRSMAGGFQAWKDAGLPVQ